MAPRPHLALQILAVSAALGGAGPGLSLGPTAAAASGNFAGSCNVKTANLTGSWLGMYCDNLNTAQYGYNWTWIDLNWCIINSGGSLAGRASGGFFATCTGCAVDTSGDAFPGMTLRLSCACSDTKGGTPTSTLDLNTVLANSDGSMGCFGRWGNKTLAGPPHYIS